MHEAKAVESAENVLSRTNTVSTPISGAATLSHLPEISTPVDMAATTALHRRGGHAATTVDSDFWTRMTETVLQDDDDAAAPLDFARAPPPPFAEVVAGTTSIENSSKVPVVAMPKSAQPPTDPASALPLRLDAMPSTKYYVAPVASGSLPNHITTTAQKLLAKLQAAHRDCIVVQRGAHAYVRSDDTDGMDESNPDVRRRPGGTSRQVQSAAASLPDVFCDPGFTFSVYDANVTLHFALQSETVAITKGSMKYVDHHLRYGSQTRFRFQLCRRYLQGRCQKGAECSYIHGTQLPAATHVHFNYFDADGNPDWNLARELISAGDTTTSTPNVSSSSSGPSILGGSAGRHTAAMSSAAAAATDDPSNLAPTDAATLISIGGITSLPDDAQQPDISKSLLDHVKAHVVGGGADDEAVESAERSATSHLIVATASQPAIPKVTAEFPTYECMPPGFSLAVFSPNNPHNPPQFIDTGLLLRTVGAVTAYNAQSTARARAAEEQQRTRSDTAAASESIAKPSRGGGARGGADIVIASPHQAPTLVMTVDSDGRPQYQLVKPGGSAGGTDGGIPSSGGDHGSSTASPAQDETSALVAAGFNPATGLPHTIGLRVKHCAHFQFKRICNLGYDCHFIHSKSPYSGNTGILSGTLYVGGAAGTGPKGKRDNRRNPVVAGTDSGSGSGSSGGYHHANRVLDDADGETDGTTKSVTAPCVLANQRSVGRAAKQRTANQDGGGSKSGGSATATPRGAPLSAAAPSITIGGVPAGGQMQLVRMPPPHPPPPAPPMMSQTMGAPQGMMMIMTPNGPAMVMMPGSAANASQGIPAMMPSSGGGHYMTSSAHPSHVMADPMSGMMMMVPVMMPSPAGHPAEVSHHHQHHPSHSAPMFTTTMAPPLHLAHDHQPAPAMFMSAAPPHHPHHQVATYGHYPTAVHQPSAAQPVAWYYTAAPATAPQPMPWMHTGGNPPQLAPHHQPQVMYMMQHVPPPQPPQRGGGHPT